MEHHVAKVVAAPLGSTETTSEERDQETLKGNMETQVEAGSLVEAEVLVALAKATVTMDEKP